MELHGGERGWFRLSFGDLRSAANAQPDCVRRDIVVLSEVAIRGIHQHQKDGGAPGTSIYDKLMEAVVDRRIERLRLNRETVEAIIAQLEEIGSETDPHDLLSPANHQHATQQAAKLHATVENTTAWQQELVALQGSDTLYITDIVGPQSGPHEAA